MRDRVAVGTMVRVPLAGRRVGGWIASLTEGTAEVDVERLLPVAKITGIGPGLDIFDLAEWAVPRWAGRLRAFLVAASPTGAVVGLPAPAKGPPVPEPVDANARRLLAAGGGVL